MGKDPLEAASTTPTPEVLEFVDNQASIQTRRMYHSDVEDLARFVAGRGRPLREALREDLVGWFRSLEKR